MPPPFSGFPHEDTRRRTFLRFGGVLLVGIALAAVAWGSLQKFRRQRACESNLLKIYAALEQYEYEAGVLPEMAYYPDDVRLDPESMYSILEPYGLAATNCVCPGCAAVLQDTGITYVWNTQVNGKPLRSLDPPQWLVVEMNALSAKVPAPHWGRYNVLYSDGKVRDEGRRP